MKRLSIRSLAVTGVFLLMMVSGVSACGRQTQNTQAGIGAAPGQSANSGSDELQRWQAALSQNAANGDELQRWQNKPAIKVEEDELQRWAARYPNVRR